MKLSVIIPQYNELENLKNDVLEEVFSFLSEEVKDFEIIISDDGSADGSFEYSENYAASKKDNIKILKNIHGGKAHAILKGIEAAQGEFVLFTDMDQSTDISYSKTFLEIQSSTNSDCIIGKRIFIKKRPLLREIAHHLYKIVRRLIILREINDTQCGFKLIRADYAKAIFPYLEATKIRNAKGWDVTAFDAELLHILKKAGAKITEVPVNWVDRDKSTHKNRRIIKEAFNMLQATIKVRINEIRGDYSRFEKI